VSQTPNEPTGVDQTPTGVAQNNNEPTGVDQTNDPNLDRYANDLAALAGVETKRSQEWMTTPTSKAM
jgi:hypothetical protein